MPHVISVRPTVNGWAVERGDEGAGEIHASAAAAERAAKALGERLAPRGEDAEILFFLKDGGPAARFLCSSQVLEWA